MRSSNLTPINIWDKRRELEVENIETLVKEYFKHGTFEASQPERPFY